MKDEKTEFNWNRRRNILDFRISASSEGAVKVSKVGYSDVSSCCFYPFSTACFSPLHPLFGTVCLFLRAASKLWPLVAFNETRESFFGGPVRCRSISSNVLRCFLLHRKRKKHSMYLLKRVCILFYDELENTVARHEVFIRL